MRRSDVRTQVDPKTTEMDPMKFQIRPSTRSNLFARIHRSSKSNCVILASILLAIALFLYYGSLFSGKILRDSKRKFGIIIDGGSSGTRIHVFTCRVEGGNVLCDFGNNGLASMKVNPGLSSFAEDADGAARSLVKLLEFGKGWVPKDGWSDTEIRLMATAGMRMLEVNVQERILDACRKVLRSSGFKFRDEWASVITGSDEGVYAWVVANYALGTLGGDPLQTTGIIELGGASAQVTFVSSESMPSRFSSAVSFGNITYNLYSHSFLHFGLDVALDSWREALILGDFNLATQSLQKGFHFDPCTPKGYSHNVESFKLSPGSLSGKHNYQPTLQTRGNFSECRSALVMLLQKRKEMCSYQCCDMGSTFISKFQGKFLATENFFHTSKFFGLGQRAYLSELMTANHEFCGEDWSVLKKKHQAHDKEDLLRYCFSSAYIVALLHDSLGIALDDERVKAVHEVGNMPLDWALGAFILQSTTDWDRGQYLHGGSLS